MNRRDILKVAATSPFVAMTGVLSSIATGQKTPQAEMRTRIVIPSIDDECNPFCRRTRPGGKYRYCATQAMILIGRCYFGDRIVTALPCAGTPPLLQTILLAKHNQDAFWWHGVVWTQKIRAGRYFGAWRSWSTIGCEIDLIGSQYKRFTMGCFPNEVFFSLLNIDI